MYERPPLNDQLQTGTTNEKTILLVLVCFVGFQSAEAQIKIDVKTDLNVKARYTVIKTGIVKMIDSSPNYEVVNTGEDYSLWITSIGRSQYAVLYQR